MLNKFDQTAKDHPLLSSPKDSPAFQLKTSLSQNPSTWTNLQDL